MYRQLTRFTNTLAVFLILTWMAGCGGGGGGGGSTSTTDSYTGLTTQATITTTNGSEIATTSYTHGNSATSIGGVLGAPLTPGTPERGGPASVNLSDWAHQQIRFALVQPGVSSPAKEVRSVSESVSGSCGGTATYTITADSDTGSFSGTFTFSSFCEDAATISGTLTFSGTISTDGSDTFASTSMSFTSLTIVTAGESLTANGTLTTSASGATVTITSDLLLTNNTTDESFLTDDLVLTVVDSGSSASITLAGRLYHAEYGYVTLSTPTAMVIVVGDEYPSSGKLVATGANGGTVSLTALSNTTYQIDIDVTGNGTIESTTTGTWGA